MNLFIFFVVFTLFWGASWGSFVNVLIHRIPLDMSVVFPSSACPQCQHKIRWYENIPVLSYLVLLGRCSQCKMVINPRYPLIEAAAGVWSLTLAWHYVWPIWSQPDLWVYQRSILLIPCIQWLWLLSFVCALLAITFIDLFYTFIPDEISIPMIIWGCFGAFICMPNPLQHLSGLLIGYAVIYAIRLLGFVIYKREAMGLGDAKLLALIGVFLGWRLLPSVLFASAVQGIIASVIALLYTKITGKSNVLTMTSQDLDERFQENYESSQVYLAIPFGPFLCIAAFEILMIGPSQVLDLWQFYLG
jgi:leader peptidase (prepilin peptidase) / N-methyltransferase